jgi:hypothetical protein
MELFGRGGREGLCGRGGRDGDFSSGTRGTGLVVCSGIDSLPALSTKTCGICVADAAPGETEFSTRS